MIRLLEILACGALWEYIARQDPDGYQRQVDIINGKWVATVVSEPVFLKAYYLKMFLPKFGIV